MLRQVCTQVFNILLIVCIITKLYFIEPSATFVDPGLIGNIREQIQSSEQNNGLYKAVTITGVSDTMNITDENNTQAIANIKQKDPKTPKTTTALSVTTFTPRTILQSGHKDLKQNIKGFVQIAGTGQVLRTIPMKIKSFVHLGSGDKKMVDKNNRNSASLKSITSSLNNSQGLERKKKISSKTHGETVKLSTRNLSPINSFIHLGEGEGKPTSIKGQPRIIKRKVRKAIRKLTKI